MNLFRLTGDMMHLFSILVILLKIRATKSCRGEVGKAFWAAAVARRRPAAAAADAEAVRSSSLASSPSVVRHLAEDTGAVCVGVCVPLLGPPVLVRFCVSATSSVGRTHARRVRIPHTGQHLLLLCWRQPRSTAAVPCHAERAIRAAGTRTCQHVGTSDAALLSPSLQVQFGDEGDLPGHRL